MPVRLAVTAGTVADCSQALPLIEGIKAEHLLADKAYDTNEIVAGASARGMNPVIPPKSNRKEKRDYDRAAVQVAAFGGERFPGVQGSGGEWRPGMPRTPFLTWPSARIRAMAIWTKLL